MIIVTINRKGSISKMANYAILTVGLQKKDNPIS